MLNIANSRHNNRTWVLISLEAPAPEAPNFGITSFGEVLLSALTLMDLVPAFTFQDLMSDSFLVQQHSLCSTRLLAHVIKLKVVPTLGQIFNLYLRAIIEF